MILFLLVAPFIIHTILLLLIMILATIAWEGIKESFAEWHKR
jgi:hypothetical protein